MEIHIKTIQHNEHRYETVGDYYYDSEGVLQVRVSEMGNPLYETMVAVHEIIEEALTKNKGITEQQITDFDLYYEMRRGQGLVLPDSEPGFDISSPYRSEHTLATAVEMMMCAHAGLSWVDYDNTIKEL